MNVLKVNESGAMSVEAPVYFSQGYSDAGKLPALGELGRIDNSMLDPTLFKKEADSRVAGEALTAGDYVWINPQDGKAYLADKNTFRKASGFVLNDAAIGVVADVWRPSQLNTALTGLTSGFAYVLGALGKPEPFGSATVGALFQTLGIASSTTSMPFFPSDGIQY